MIIIQSLAKFLHIRKDYQADNHIEVVRGYPCQNTKNKVNNY